jgi:hypothetical protein
MTTNNKEALLTTLTARIAGLVEGILEDNSNCWSCKGREKIQWGNFVESCMDCTECIPRKQLRPITVNDWMRAVALSKALMRREMCYNVALDVRGVVLESTLHSQGLVPAEMNIKPQPPFEALPPIEYDLSQPFENQSIEFYEWLLGVLGESDG